MGDGAEQPKSLRIPAAYLDMVPKAGLEPARVLAHHPLKMACLPVPPLRQIWGRS